MRLDLIRARGCVCTFFLALGACIVDRSKPCDEHQVKFDGPLLGCVCADNYVPSADGKRCVACGEHELAVGNMCSCADGYYRSRPDAECERSEGGLPDAGAAPSGEGAPCSSQADCAGFQADYCQMLLAPNVCLVQGCASRATKCSAGNVCCDFKSFELLAPTGGLCIPSSTCVAPGEVVDP